MSKLSFKTFCIEKYADFKSIPSNEVYVLFEKNGVLDMLDEDYEILHGFGFEYIVNDIDRYLGGEKVCFSKNMKYAGGEQAKPHGTIRAATTKTIIGLIMDKYSVSENEALKMFYESDTGASYSDDETGLYGQSALYVFSLFEEEQR